MVLLFFLMKHVEAIDTYMLRVLLGKRWPCCDFCWVQMKLVAASDTYMLRFWVRVVDHRTVLNTSGRFSAAHVRAVVSQQKYGLHFFVCHQATHVPVTVYQQSDVSQLSTHTFFVADNDPSVRCWHCREPNTIPL